MGRTARHHGGGGGVSLAAHTFLGSGAAVDPNSVLTSFVTSGLFTQFTLENETQVSDDPFTGASFSVPLRDILGNIASCAKDDICRVGLWSEDAVLPADVVIGIAIHLGTLAVDSFGFGVALYGGVGGSLGLNFATHYRNTGSSWLITDASAGDATSRGCYCDKSGRTQGAQATIGVQPVDAANQSISSANTGTTPAAMTNWSGVNVCDTVTIFAGWKTGIGGSAGVVGKVRPYVALLKTGDLPFLDL